MATPLPTKKPKEAPPLEFVKQRYQEDCPVDAVRPHPQNANEGDVGTVYHSQGRNGFYGVIYVQESTGFIVAGNTRYFAACHHGAKTIPVLWLDIDDAKARRILAVDNRARDLANYNAGGLEDLLNAILTESGTLDGTGFDDEAFQDLHEQLHSAPGGYLSPSKGPGFGYDDRNGTETGQEGPPKDSQGQEDEAGAARGLKRLGFNMLTPNDYETVLKAVTVALEGGGAKLKNLKKRPAAEGEEYNPMTLGLLAICTSYLEQRGEAVGDDSK